MSRAGLVGVLVALGVGWGLTQPLSKIAVSTGHGVLGLIFWQLVIGTVALGALLVARRRPVPRGTEAWAFCIYIALVGTLFPNSASYAAYRHLPAGIMSVVIATVPLVAFPIAIALGTERFGAVRLLGLLAGIAGVALIAAAGSPGEAAPGAGGAAGLPPAWLLVALIAPLFYAIEGNTVARWGTAGLDPLQAMFGASAAGSLIALPLALGTGQWIDPRFAWGQPEWALILSSVIHAFAYAGYVWLVGAAGAVFAAQCSYIVTGAGVLWAMALLGERYPLVVWAAMAVMLAGVMLVQPRRQRAARG